MYMTPDEENETEDIYEDEKKLKKIMAAIDVKAILSRDMDIKISIQNANIGMNRAERHANKSCPGWSEGAIAMVALYPLEEFKTEDIRTWAYVIGFPCPPHERAWGAIIQKVKKAGIIVICGSAVTERKDSRAAHVRLWRKELTGKEYYGAIAGAGLYNDHSLYL